MAKWTMTTTEAEIKTAVKEARNAPPEPEAVSVEYIGGQSDLIVIHLSNGARLRIPREELEGLQDATEDQLSETEIYAGVDIAWPQLDVDHFLPYLLEHRYGSKKWMESLKQRGVDILHPPLAA